MKRAYIYIMLAAFIFSTMEIVSKTIATDINPFQLNFLRFFIGALILLPAAIKGIKKRNVQLGTTDLLYFLLTGFLGIVLSMSLFQFALIFTTASTVAIIFSVNPIFTIPFAYLLLKEKVNLTMGISMLVSVLGIIFILNPFHMAADLRGVIFALLSAISFALYGVLGKMRCDKYGSIAISCFSFLTGAFILILLIALSHSPFLAAIINGNTFPSFLNIPITGGINYSNIMALCYLGVVVSGLGFLFYFLAMEETSATTGSIVFFIKPALAPILAFLVLHENIPMNTIGGILFILLGACMAMIGKNGQETIPLPKHEAKTAKSVLDRI